MSGLDINKVNQKVASLLRDKLGSELVALISAGSSLGKYKDDWSDLDYLIVIKEVNIKNLGRIRGSLKELAGFYKAKFGLNVISKDEFLSPLFPCFSLEGKTLQTLLELGLDKNRILYSELETLENIYPPDFKDIRQYSLINIGIIKNSNRRDLLSKSTGKMEEKKKKVSKVIHAAFIITKLAIQYFTQKTCQSKKEILESAKEIFPDFDFLILDRDLIVINSWNNRRESGELTRIIESNSLFIERFSNYVFKKANKS